MRTATALGSPPDALAFGHTAGTDLAALRLDLSEAATAQRKIALGERIAGESRTNRQAPTGLHRTLHARRPPVSPPGTVRPAAVSVFSEFYIAYLRHQWS